MIVNLFKEGEMKALVTYYSETGNTEKLAQGIFDGIQEAEKDLMKVGDLAGVDAYDVLFIGFPVQAHGVPKKVGEFVKGLPKGTNVAFFATHGSLRGGPLAIGAFYEAVALAADLAVLGTFGSRGAVKPQIIEALLKKAEHKAWAKEAQSALGHPDAADIEDAKVFAGQMITKMRTL